MKFRFVSSPGSNYAYEPIDFTIAAMKLSNDNRLSNMLDVQGRKIRPRRFSNALLTWLIPITSVAYMEHAGSFMVCV